MTHSKSLISAWSLFLGIALLQAGVGLQRPLLGLRAEAAGFGPTAMSLVMTAYYAGFVLGTRYVGKGLGAVGHIRTFAGLASIASTIALLQGIWINPWTWGFCRLTFGLCIAALYVVAESWLNDFATNENRGGLLSSYMVVAIAATLLGQYSVGLASVSNFTLFAFASILVSMSLVPVTLSPRASAPADIPEPITIKELYSIVPTGLVICCLSGMTLGSLIGLGPVYGSIRGWSPIQIANFVGAPLAGSVVLQIPLGRLSDHVPRRAVMTVSAVGATIMCFITAQLDGTDPTSLGCLFLLGGLALPLYSMSVAYTNDWLQPGERTSAAALLVRIHGVGSFLGPLLAGLIIGTNLKVYFYFPLFSFLIMSLYLFYRIFFHKAPALEEQTPFIPFPLRASRMVTKMFSRNGH
ncbi:MAG: MFS transporter [Actinomycetota bacterium]|nr:MFS transporter [Actinomycetota bacterium]